MLMTYGYLRATAEIALNTHNKANITTRLNTTTSVIHDVLFVGPRTLVGRRVHISFNL